MVDVINQYIQNQTDKVLKKFDDRLNNRFYSDSKSSLDEFRAVISAGGGLLRSNRFVFNIPLPDFLRKSLIEDFSWSNFMQTQGLNIFDGTLGLLCQRIEVPAKSLRTSQIKIQGQTRTVPMNYSWDNITAEFIDTSNSIIYDTFYNWLDGINSPVTNTGKFYDDFVKDLRLDYLNRANEMVGYITLNEAFPISVSRSASSYGDTNYVTTRVTFSYLYQTNRDYSSNMLYNLLNNVTGGVAGQLLNTATNIVETYNPIELVKNSLNSTDMSAERKNNQLSMKSFLRLK